MNKEKIKIDNTILFKTKISSLFFNFLTKKLSLTENEVYRMKGIIDPTSLTTLIKTSSNPEWLNPDSSPS